MWGATMWKKEEEEEEEERKREYVDVWFSMISQSTVGVAFMRGRLESVPLFGSVLLTPKN